MTCPYSLSSLNPRKVPHIQMCCLTGELKAGSSDGGKQIGEAEGGAWPPRDSTQMVPANLNLAFGG